jgi:hypothetical protein
MSANVSNAELGSHFNFQQLAGQFRELASLRFIDKMKNCATNYSMDWIGFQHKLRPDWIKYFSERALTLPRIESAKSRDIGEQAKNIDAVIRALSRGGHFLPLSEDENDILAIRLDWAWQFSKQHIFDPWPLGEEATEDGFEQLLINQWQQEGRETYQTEKERINSLLKKVGTKQPANRAPSQNEPPPKKPSSPPHGRF